MALNSFVGQLTQPTSTNATFATTGVGFKPKVVIFFFNDKTADGSAIILSNYIGMATSTSNRVGMSSRVTTAATSDRFQDSTKCLIVQSISGVSLVAADLVSFDSDGFTLNFSTVDATARKVNFICLGGPDITNANILTVNMGTGTQAVTGMGFKPDALFVISPGFGTTDPGGDTNNGGSTILGFASSASATAVTGADTTDTVQKSGGDILIRPVGGGGGIKFEASIASIDSDGFTLTWATASSGRNAYFLGLKGGRYKVGVFNQSTSTGNQSVTGAGFTPVGVILASQDIASSTSVQNSLRKLSMGAASDATHRKSMWSGTDNTNFNQNLDSSNVIKTLTPGAAGSPTTNTVADFVSFDNDGFTINNTTADATTREITYILFGNNFAPAGLASWVTATISNPLIGNDIQII